MHIYHHGIKGMKWGVRRYRDKNGRLNPADTKKYYLDNGLILEKEKPGIISRTLRKHNEKARKEQERTSSYKIKVGKKKVGDLLLYHESAESLNITWLGIKSKERGKHYASTVMDWVIADSKRKRYSQLTLEVPTNSPDARHIYEKKGFEVGEKLSEDDIWGGLTAMKKKIK